MNSLLVPLETRERHVIRSGTGIVGGVLLARAGIVVDFDENPDPYLEVLANVRQRLEWEDVWSTHTILKAVRGATDRSIPYDPRGYQRTLRQEAERIGVDNLTPENQIGLSQFMESGGICHQWALVGATTIELLQRGGELSGSVSLESGQPNEAHPDRHVMVDFTEAGQEQTYTLSINGGLYPPFDPAPLTHAAPIR